jgi:hypothetical protein
MLFENLESIEENYYIHFSQDIKEKIKSLKKFIVINENSDMFRYLCTSDSDHINIIHDLFINSACALS